MPDPPNRIVGELDALRSEGIIRAGLDPAGIFVGEGENAETLDSSATHFGCGLQARVGR